MDFYDILLAKKLDGGGSSVEVEPLSVTENGTYQEEGKAYSPVNVDVQSPQEAEVKDVNFFDYDGTCLYSYTFDEWTNVTELPANPVHDGLIAQGWNWTKNDINAELAVSDRPIYVGQSYVTSDGSTEIDIELIAPALSPWLHFSSTGTIKIDWGDGNEETSTSSVKDYNHTYQSEGDYTIKLTVLTGKITLSGDDYAKPASCKPLLSNKSLSATDKSNGVYASAVKQIRLGQNVLLGNCAFSYLVKLTSITIPNNITAISTYAFAYTRDLKYVTIPSGVTVVNLGTFMSSGVSLVSLPRSITSIDGSSSNGAFYSSALRDIHLGDNITNLGINAFGTYRGDTIEIPSKVTTLSDSLLSSAQCRHLVIKGNITSIDSGALAYIYYIPSITFPSSLATIGGSNYSGAFSNSRFMEYHFTSTTPPSLHQNAFMTGNEGITRVFYVPYSADHSVLTAYQTATNWSTYASDIQEEPQQ